MNDVFFSRYPAERGYYTRQSDRVLFGGLAAVIALVAIGLATMLLGWWQPSMNAVYWTIAVLVIGVVLCMEISTRIRQTTERPGYWRDPIMFERFLAAKAQAEALHYARVTFLALRDDGVVITRASRPDAGSAETWIGIQSLDCYRLLWAGDSVEVVPGNDPTPHLRHALSSEYEGEIFPRFLSLKRVG